MIGLCSEQYMDTISRGIEPIYNKNPNTFYFTKFGDKYGEGTQIGSE